MTTVSLHGPPRWPVVLAEQVRSVGVLLRSGGTMLVVAIGALAAIGIYAALDVKHFNLTHAPYTISMNVAFDTELGSVTMVIAAFLPFLVWQDEDPTQRFYHWAMPVARGRHSFSKVFAGWLWMMAVTLLFVSSIGAVSVVVEQITGIPQHHAPHFAAWEWLVPFGSATVAYLFGSALAVGVTRPILWISGVALTFGFIPAVLRTLQLMGAAKRVTAVMSGRLGLLPTLFGYVRWMDDASDKYSMLPHLGSWVGATLLWAGLGAALLVLALYRHAEPT